MEKVFWNTYINAGAYNGFFDSIVGTTNLQMDLKRFKDLDNDIGELIV